MKNTNLVSIKNLNGKQKLCTTSLKIAEVFGKRHDHVIRDIEALINDGTLSEFYWAESYYIDLRKAKRKMIELSSFAEDFLKKKYKGQYRLSTGAREKDCLDTIEQVLGIKLIRQFTILDYRIDGYHVESKTAYEIDEPHHKHNTYKDKKRQKEIEEILKCKFVRIKLN